MRLNLNTRAALWGAAVMALMLTATPRVSALQVTYAPYLQPGDNGPFGAQDQVVVAWQTDEATPNAGNYRVDYGTTTSYGNSVTPAGRVVDNYLAADSKLPAGVQPYGAHTNYVAVIANLSYDTTYFYRVSGPGLPSGGFTASFHTRKRGNQFSFIVEGDEGMFPANPNTNPSTLVDYEARINHLMYNSSSITFAGQPARPAADFYLNTGDNVYTDGSEDNYGDFFFPIFNSNVDSNETGAPIIRNYFYYIVTGNHDVGSTGVNVEMLSRKLGATVQR
jgi:Purple acid Phosphatase, N-terminal domain